MRSPLIFIATVACIVSAGPISAADGPPRGRGPAKVTAEPGAMGVLAPQAEVRGSVYFKAVSEVATEVAGKVLEVLFDEGDLVTEGQELVRLDDQLVRKDLGALTARLERDRIMLKDAETRLARSENLVGRGLSPAEQLDETRYSVEALRYSVAASEAEVSRLETVLSKTVIRSPFDGVVLDRPTGRGEWRGAGQTVALIAKSGLYEVVASLPETSVPYVAAGDHLEIQIGGQPVTGTVATVIPRGDITTRTFPLKVRIESSQLLMEGMTAFVRTPIGPRTECLMVPRDAVLNQQGAYFVVTVQDGVARRHPVKVLGFQDLMAGIEAPELGPGQLFVTEGHERLRDGDAVELAPAGQTSAGV